MVKYKIFCTAWQIMHWWDFFNALKEDANFYMVNNNHRSWRDERFLAARPIPENVTFVPYYEKGKYDFAVLNVDQQVMNPQLGKSKLMMELLELIKDIPITVINHGSPVYPELLATEGVTFEEAEKICIDMTKKLVGDRPMITNSYDAASDKEWGFGYPIIHGLSKDDWWDLPKEPRVFTALSIAGFDEYYNRAVMNETASQLKRDYGHTVWWAKNNVDTHTSWDRYREFLGRSLIYLDTSFRTPMNRARTEAMLSGCCVVQVKGAHDLKRFAKDGENMILVDNKPEKISMLLNDLLEKRYDECIKIGKAGKETAIKLFNRERYRQDWLKYIKEVLKV